MPIRRAMSATESRYQYRRMKMVLFCSFIVSRYRPIASPSSRCSSRQAASSGNAIDDYVSQFGYGIVKDLVGHGIGTSLHEDPQIPNFRQKRKGLLLQPGMTLAIEPMINMGTWEVEFLDDDWTVVTRDGLPSAHYENTILITDGEPEILTII